METWQLLLVAFGAVAATLIATLGTGVRQLLLAWFDRRAKAMARVKFTGGVQQVAEFHRVLELFRDLKFVDRMLVFRGSNCGGIPDPKRPYTVRCFYGWSKDPAKHPEDSYDFDLRVDRHYMEMVADVITNGKSFQAVERMPVDARLRGYYEAEGVKFSALYFLSLDDSDNALMYISVASYTVEFTPVQLAQLDFVIDRARAALSR